ncbi:hypothetical protein ACK366_10915, partial [Aeromonas veronii]
GSLSRYSKSTVRRHRRVSHFEVEFAYPLSKDPKSKFGSISSFITFKPETQIVLNVTQKIIRISSPKSELVIPTTELADNIDEFSRITAETFDDYLIQQISRQTKN